MAVEDFGADWTEVDSAGSLTVSGDTVTASTVGRNEECYVYRDFGPGHFSGDFEHIIAWKPTYAENFHVLGVYYLTNDADDVRLQDRPNLQLRSYHPNELQQLRLIHSAVLSAPADDSITLSIGTQYYLEFERDESIGTYGQAQCRIYDDAARTSLVDTITISLVEAKDDYRYGVVAGSWPAGSDSHYGSHVISGLDLQEGGAVGSSAGTATASGTAASTASTAGPRAGASSATGAGAETAAAAD